MSSSVKAVDTPEKNQDDLPDLEHEDKGQENADPAKPSAVSKAVSSFFQWFKNNSLFAFMVILPVALVSLYYGAFASDRFVSKAEIIVKDSNSGKAIPSAMDLMLTGGGSNTQDALLVVNYLGSLDLALSLQDEMKLKDYYRSNGDYFSKLSDTASKEEYLRYYRDHLSVSHDELAGIVTLEAQSFSPEFAQQLASKVIDKAEVFVNSINLQVANRQLAFVNSELERAQQRLIDVRQKMLAFQDDHNVVSPELALKGVSHIIQELEMKLAEESTKLSAFRSYLNEDSSQVQALLASIQSIKVQIQEEKRRIVGSQSFETQVTGYEDQINSAPLNKMTAEFQKLELQHQFALDAYQLALTSIEKARIEATNQLKHLVIVTQPSHSEDATYPTKLYNLATLTIVLLMLYGILKMLIAAIKDHRA